MNGDLDEADAADAGDAPPSRPGTLTRRRLLAGSGLASAGLVAAACARTSAGAAGSPGGTESAGAAASDPAGGGAVSFHGVHQAGIVTAAQERLVFATYDVTTSDAYRLQVLLDQWTAAAERFTAGRPLAGPDDHRAPPVDTGEALGLGPARLTLTVGFGPGLFDGRFGLAARRPAPLQPLPAFPGDALDPARSGGDLCIQACADDPQVAFHAVHNLTRLALGTAAVRSVQVGFGRTSSTSAAQQTPRNLLGFKDGTDNLVAQDTASLAQSVWVDERADPAWMRGGTYLVARRIRMHLEAWDRSTVGEQEATIGRHKQSGAPLGGIHEHDPVDLQAVGPDGLPVVPANAHIRLASPLTHHGARLLRRGYSFADGVDPVTGELDAGLFFICFQSDPRQQFVPIQMQLAEQDALTEYVVHTASSLFACPPGTAPGRSWADALFGPPS